MQRLVLLLRAQYSRLRSLPVFSLLLALALLLLLGLSAPLLQPRARALRHPDLGSMWAGFAAAYSRTLAEVQPQQPVPQILHLHAQLTPSQIQTAQARWQTFLAHAPPYPGQELFHGRAIVVTAAAYQVGFAGVYADAEPAGLGPASLSLQRVAPGRKGLLCR